MSEQRELEKVLPLTRIQLTHVFHALQVVAFYSVLYLTFFSPVILLGRLLAPGDGIHYYLPNFYLGKMFWDPLLLSGFPVAADPQAMTWYPLSWIFSFIGSWNGFVISAYVLGSSFTYGYVYTLTQSRLNGLVSGIIYGMSGFMMVHLGHTSIIHGAVWLPLLIWALEKQRFYFSPFWFAATSIAVAFSFLSGHPQLSVYTLGVGTAYAVWSGWSLEGKRWKYYGLSLLAAIIGLGLASIQLIPASELISYGLRSEMSFKEFISYSLPPYQAIELFFPNLFGSYQESPYGFPYFGQWNLVELTGYVGLLSLLLTTIGILTYYRKTIAWFWVGIGVLAFLLTLGNTTPLAKIMFHVPLFNSFRAPARHFFEVALAISVLSGLGIAAVQSRMISKKSILRVLLMGSGIMLLCLTAILLFSERLKAFALAKGIQALAVLPWSNPAVGIPLIVFILASVTLFFWSRRNESRVRQIFLLTVLILDLASFGWFVQWRYHSPQNEFLTPPASAQRYQPALEKSHQRMVPIRGVMGSIGEFPPNLSRLWNIPSASGYGPLILSRISGLLAMPPWGGVTGNWSSLHNRNLDVMAIRYVFLPKNDTTLAPVIDPNGISWSKDDLTISLGTGCGPPQPSSVMINLPSPVSATSIGMVSSMACSTAIPDRSEVVRIVVTDIHEKTYSVSVQAGRDTSEWAYDCHDVLPLMKHRRAQVHQSFPVERGGRKEEGHRYAATLSLGKELEIKRIELQWVGPPAAIGIQKISLFDEKTGKSFPLSPVMGDLANPERWRHVEDRGEISVYENLRAMPRAWLVSEVVSAKSEEVLQMIQSSRLPEGRIFNPSQTALVEEPLSFQAKDRDDRATAQVVHLSNTQIEIHTTSGSPSFLVMSDVYYPGWNATMDGHPTHIFQTNYVLRGVMVPAGGHVVRFEFKPKSFYLGAGISALSLLFLMVFLSYRAIYFKKRKR